MEDKFHIETYREHEIWYNADTDKFTVELLIEGNWNEKGRKSLKECRKAIDVHIRTTAEFKPIKVIFRDAECTIKSVRTDGGLVFTSGEKDFTEISCVLEQLNGKRSFYPIHEYSPEYLEWLKERERIEKENSERIRKHAETKPELKLLDLSFIRNFMSQ